MLIELRSLTGAVVGRLKVAEHEATTAWIENPGTGPDGEPFYLDSGVEVRVVGEFYGHEREGELTKLAREWRGPVRETEGTEGTEK